MGNELAPAGQLWVCSACGKRSRDRYGDAALDRGWDESCMLHAVLCDEATIVLGDDGRAKWAKAISEADPTP